MKTREVQSIVSCVKAMLQHNLHVNHKLLDVIYKNLLALFLMRGTVEALDQNIQGLLKGLHTDFVEEQQAEDAEAKDQAAEQVSENSSDEEAQYALQLADDQ